MECLYKNKNLPTSERVEDLLSKMTLEEKLGQMMQVSLNIMNFEEAEAWAAKGVGSFLHCLGENAEKLKKVAKNTRLGIPLIFGIDAIHGHSLYNGATIFPSQLGVSCSWNPELIKEMGRVTAKEVAADGLHWTFSPVLCIGRDLRWGRVGETFGEDAYLIGELGAAIIDGYQCDGHIVACAKHYLAYGESTGGRDSYDSEVSVRKVKGIFLLPFKRAVEAGCATVMAGYESVDGVPISSNEKVLRKLLKEELQFEGFVVTDWGNIEGLIERQFVVENYDQAAILAVQAGNDMSMNSIPFYESAIKKAKDGEIPIALIDDAVRRILGVKFKLGLFDEWQQPNMSIIACKEHIAINEELTRESLVLLENKNNTLPLNKNIKKIVVIGPNADDLHAQFGDWTYFSHPDANPTAIPKGEYYTMLSGIKKVFVNSEIVYHKGCDIMDAEQQQIAESVAVAKDADAIIAVVGDCLAQNGEFKDRANLELSGAQTELLKALKETGKPLVGVLVNGKPLCIEWLQENCDALVETFNSGTHGGLALAELLCGAYNPNGKLTISFPRIAGQTVIYYNQLPGWHGGSYIDARKGELYQFGYGLSYTEYEYSNLRLSKDVCSKDDIITVFVDVTNAGKVDGKEIIQLYINDCVSSVVTPVKELKGFQKVFIKAGETVTVSIPLAISNLAIVDVNEQYVVENGNFEIMVGKDSRDESLLKTTLIVE